MSDYLRNINLVSPDIYYTIAVIPDILHQRTPLVIPVETPSISPATNTPYTNDGALPYPAGTPISTNVKLSTALGKVLG